MSTLNSVMIKENTVNEPYNGTVEISPPKGGPMLSGIGFEGMVSTLNLKVFLLSLIHFTSYSFCYSGS